MNNLVSKIGALVTIAAIMSGCEPKIGSKYDKKYVKDAAGRVYQLWHNVGNTYFIYPVNKAEIDSLKVEAK